MSGVGEQALDVYLYGERTNGPPVSVPFCRSDNSRPKLGSIDRGFIYDLATAQLLQWNGSRWETTDGTPVRTHVFVQTDPSFAEVPRMGAPVTCLPGKWAGFPVPTFTYGWSIDGEAYPNNFTSQFGRNADELAFLKQGREIRCSVSASQEPATPGGESWLDRVYCQAVGYIRPALPA